MGWLRELFLSAKAMNDFSCESACLEMFRGEVSTVSEQSNVLEELEIRRYRP